MWSNFHDSDIRSIPRWFEQHSVDREGQWGRFLASFFLIEQLSVPNHFLYLYSHDDQSFACHGPNFVRISHDREASWSDCRLKTWILSVSVGSRDSLRVLILDDSHLWVHFRPQSYLANRFCHINWARHRFKIKRHLLYKSADHCPRLLQCRFLLYKQPYWWWSSEWTNCVQQQLQWYSALLKPWSARKLTRSWVQIRHRSSYKCSLVFKSFGDNLRGR